MPDITISNVYPTQIVVEIYRKIIQMTQQGKFENDCYGGGVHTTPTTTSPSGWEIILRASFPIRVSVGMSQPHTKTVFRSLKFGLSSFGGMMDDASYFRIPIVPFIPW
jgi:hypothetical protein